MDREPRKLEKVKGETRTVLIEALRLLMKQQHIELLCQDRCRSHSLELHLETTIISLQKMLSEAIFFDDNKPFSLDMLLNEMGLNHLIAGGELCD